MYSTPCQPLVPTKAILFATTVYKSHPSRHKPSSIISSIPVFILPQSKPQTSTMVHLKALLTLALATSITATQTTSTCDDAYNKCVTAPGANMSTCFSDRKACRHGQINSRAKLHLRHPVRVVSAEGDCQEIFDKCRSAPGANISTCVSDKAACDDGESE